MGALDIIVAVSIDRWPAGLGVGVGGNSFKIPNNQRFHGSVDSDSSVGLSKNLFQHYLKLSQLFSSVGEGGGEGGGGIAVGWCKAVHTLHLAGDFMLAMAGTDSD